MLFSTACYIKKQPYQLRIEIGENEFSISTIDDILLKIDTHQSTSNTANILSSIQFHFESSINNNTTSDDNDDDAVPEIIPLNKLLTVKLQNDSNSSTMEQQSSEIYSSETTYVDLSYIDVSESFLWRMKRIQLRIDATNARQLCQISTQFLSKLKHRPRHLLVFINPQCGKGEGKSVYEETVLPLFEEANIDVETIYTERANHARDYIAQQSIDHYDGLVCVGGDGMFAELCHSLLLKTAQQAGLDINDSNVHLKQPNLRLGVIPAGSTDAVAFGTTGHNDPITNALQIIVGESLPIDIATVHSERGFVCFMITMLAYGFFGNIIEQSDQWRIFGPLRYTLAGIFQFIRNTSYPTKLTIAQVPEKSSSKVTTGKTSSLQIKREGQYRIINCLNMPCRCDKSKYGMSPSVHLGDGSFDVILVKHSWRLNFLQFLHQVAEDGRSIEELSNVERFRATEVVIHPIVTQQKERGNWACDGELITANELRIRAHHQALNIFASGIRLDQIKKINEENSEVTLKSITEGSHWTYWIIFLSLFTVIGGIILSFVLPHLFKI